MKVFYYWSEDGERELCRVEKIVTEQETRCYHCDTPIPANNIAVKLQSVGEPYILHTDCAIKSCNLHPAEAGMRNRFLKYMEQKFYKVCRVRCKHCGDILEYTNKDINDNPPSMIWCSCRKVGLDPSTSLYRIAGRAGVDFEDLSEVWEEGVRNDR